ncbi:Uncharacterised protein [Vibrio cholerae]|nr:Uncharacterised protein [Vibrio cholerae]
MAIKAFSFSSVIWIWPVSSFISTPAFAKTEATRV